VITGFENASSVSNLVSRCLLPRNTGPHNCLYAPDYANICL